MMSTMELLGRGPRSGRLARKAVWVGVVHWPKTPGIVVRAPASVGAACQSVYTRVAGAVDRVAVQGMRLAVLGMLVWGGSAMVRHVTAALQQAAGHSPAARVQARLLR